MWSKSVVLLMALVLVMGLAVGCSSNSGTKSLASNETTKEKQEAKPTAAQDSKPAQPIKIKVAIPRKSFGFLPLVIGDLKGIFKEEGIDQEIMQMESNVTVAALMSGDVEFGGAGSSIMRVAAKGEPLRVIFFLYDRATFAFIGRPEIKSIDQLKGKIIGVNSPGDSTEVAAKAALSKASKLDPAKDVTFFKVGSGGAATAAMQGGSVHAMMVNSDIAARLEQEGYNNLLFAGDIMPTPFSGFGTSVKLLNEQPELVKRWLRALARSAIYTRDNLEEVTQLSSKEFNMPVEIARKAAEINIKAIRPGVPGDATEEGLKLLIQQDVQEATGLTEPVPTAKLVDFTLLRQVQQEMAKQK